MFVMEANIQSSLFNAKGLLIANREALRLSLLEHRVKRLPERFKGGSGTAPGGKFQFKRRSSRYNKRKQRIWGHSTPLVYSGELRDTVFRTARVVATSKRGELRASGSRKSRLSAEMRREIEFIPPSEETEFRQTIRDTIVFLSKDPRLQRQRKSRTR
jgi:hypothetical protein